jgi:predicted ATPase
LRICRRAWRASAHGNAITVAHGLHLLADAYRQAGRCDEGLHALASLEPGDERRHEAEASRLHGDLLVLAGQPEAAEARYRTALAVAREQSAKALELRAAMSQARVWRDRGRRPAARDLLAPVYGWFTEGFATPDLKEARALLDELA